MGTGMAPSRCRRNIATSIMFGFGLPQLAQLGQGLLLSNMLPRSPDSTFVSWSSRGFLHRSFRDGHLIGMSAVSPPAVKQQEGDGDALRPRGDGESVDEVATAAATAAESSVLAGGKSGHRRNGEGGGGTGNSGTHEARRSKWPWRRRPKNGERKREQEEERVLGEGTGDVVESQQPERAGTSRFTYDWDNGERVIWRASKKSRAQVEEGTRKLNDYLALPPTEYSLLDPKMITRLSDETFRMDGATMSIVGTKIKPIIFVKVEVQPEHNQANIMVERVELDGSDAVRSAAGSFNVTSSTIVSCAEMEGNTKAMELSTASDIEIEILVPNENFVPVGVLRRAGNFVMQRVVDIGVPQFTMFLKRDYARWAEGDDSRAAVASDGEALIAPEDG